jgi:hypothetical protein
VPKYGKSQWQLVRERFVRSPQAQVGFFFVASFTSSRSSRLYLAPYEPDQLIDSVNDEALSRRSAGRIRSAPTSSAETCCRA